MGTMLIVECPHCGGLLMAAERQKTRTCPYCGAKIDLRRAHRLASAEDAFTASSILRDLKSKRGFPNPTKG
jgi:DNA-directed RNA polymerase subunit RPC12/RpoP